LQLRAAEASARLMWRPYMCNPKLRDRLHRITTPTLVMHGEEDRLVPLQIAHAYAEGIPGAKLVTVPDCGHYPMFEQTEAFLRHTLEFLR
jgi:pimeloyl-ACP methyl ester carboxylesterase